MHYLKSVQLTESLFIPPPLITPLRRAKDTLPSEVPTRRVEERLRNFSSERHSRVEAVWVTGTETVESGGDL